MNRIVRILAITLFLACGRLFAQEVLLNCVLSKSDSAVSAVAWSADGKYFATSWNSSVILWDAATNTICAVWSGHSDALLSMAFSRDGQWFLSVSQDNSVIIRNIDEKISAIKITGEGQYPIRDAVFMDNGYSVMTPVDGLHTTHCFRLVMTKQFIFRSVTSSPSPVVAVDVDNALNRLLTTAEDGTVKLFDIGANMEIQSYPRYAGSGIGAVFSPDGNYFLSAADKTSLVITPTDGPGAFAIRDSDMPVNAAIYHPDGTKIAAATQNGLVKVYNVADGSVDTVYNALVEKGDVVETLTYSPDGEFLLAGTRRGYVFRWSIGGKELVPVRKSYGNKDFEKLAEVYTDQTILHDARTDAEEKASEAAKKKNNSDTEAPRNSLEVYAKYNTLNSNYYYGSFGLGAAYRNYRFFPLYVGFGGELSANVPDGTYPFKNYDPEKYGKVWVYGADVFGLVGLSFYVPAQSLLIFTEARAGVNVKTSFNNNVVYYQIGGPYVAGAFDVLTGVQWKWLRLTVGTEFDTDFNFMFKAGVGYVFHFRNRTAQKVPADED